MYVLVRMAVSGWIGGSITVVYLEHALKRSLEGNTLEVCLLQ